MFVSAMKQEVTLAGGRISAENSLLTEAGDGIVLVHTGTVNARQCVRDPRRM